MINYKLESGNRYNVCCDIVNNKHHYSYTIDLIFIDYILDCKDNNIYYRFLTNSELIIKLPQNIILSIEDNG